MSNPSRRAFVMTVVAGTSALAASRVSAQAAAPKLEESDPQAMALGYKADATKVDKAKYPQHAATQLCSGCNFYQGKADRRDGAVPAVRRQAGGGQGLVYGLGEEGLNGARAPRGVTIFGRAPPCGCCRPTCPSASRCRWRCMRALRSRWPRPAAPAIWRCWSMRMSAGVSWPICRGCAAATASPHRPTMRCTGAAPSAACA